MHERFLSAIFDLGFELVTERVLFEEVGAFRSSLSFHPPLLSLSTCLSYYACLSLFAQVSTIDDLPFHIPLTALRCPLSYSQMQPIPSWVTERKIATHLEHLRRNYALSRFLFLLEFSKKSDIPAPKPDDEIEAILKEKVIVTLSLPLVMGPFHSISFG